MPKKGTLERLMLDKLLAGEGGVTYLDFVGTGITEENIESVVENLRTGMYESESDHLFTKDD